MEGPFQILCIRVPYYIGDLNGDPNLENYPLDLLNCFFDDTVFLACGSEASTREPR